MALSFKNPKQKQKILLVIFLISFLVTGAVWWFGLKKKKPEITLPPDSRSFLRTIRIDFEFLKSENLKSFQKFQEIPPFKGPQRKENPFLP